jgi:hypothetical protein
MLPGTENMLLLDLSSGYREGVEKENVMKILRYRPSRARSPRRQI